MIAVLLAVVLSACGPGDDGAGYLEGEREIIELSHLLKLGEYRFGLSDSVGWKELDSLKIILSDNEVRLWNLHVEQSAVTNEIERLATLNKELGRTVIEQKRSATQGMNFETFSASNGRIFKNATITLVDDSGVALRHEDGAARLRYAELSDDQRLIYGLEEEAALAAEDRERRQALAYELSIDMELGAMRDKASEQRAAPISAGSNNFLASHSLMTSPNHQREIRPLAQPARTFRSGSLYRRWHGHSGHRPKRPTYHYVYRHVSVPGSHCMTSRVRMKSSGFPSGTCTFTPATP